MHPRVAPRGLVLHPSTQLILDTAGERQLDDEDVLRWLAEAQRGAYLKNKSGLDGHYRILAGGC